MKKAFGIISFAPKVLFKCRVFLYAIIFLSLSITPFAVCADNTNLTPIASLLLLGVERKLYVANMGDGSISVVNLKNASVVDEISVGANPAEICIMPLLNRAYVTDIGDNKIHIINTATKVALPPVTTSRPVGGLDCDVTRKKNYALDFSNGLAGTNIHVIDASSNTETADTLIGSKLQDIRIDSVSNRAYVTDFNEGLKVIDLSNNTVINTIAVNNGPHGLAVDSVANTVYVTQVNGGTVAVVDLLTGSIVKSISVGSNPQWVIFNSLYTEAYVTNQGEGTVSVIDTATRAVTDTITVGVNPFFIIIDHDSNKAYVSNEGDNTVSVIDTSSHTVVNTISVGIQPIGLAILPKK